MVKLSNEEVIEYIENFISGKGQDWDWDDFISSSIEDNFLNNISIECSKTCDIYPPVNGIGYCSEEGIEFMRTLIQKIKERKS